MDETNIVDERLAYENPVDAPEWEKEYYRRAVQDMETNLAIVADLQEQRKNEAGDICEPISQVLVNTVLERYSESWQSALCVLDAMGAPKQVLRRSRPDPRPPEVIKALEEIK